MIVPFIYNPSVPTISQVENSIPTYDITERPCTCYISVFKLLFDTRQHILGRLFRPPTNRFRSFCSTSRISAQACTIRKIFLIFLCGKWSGRRILGLSLGHQDLANGLCNTIQRVLSVLAEIVPFYTMPEMWTGYWRFRSVTVFVVGTWEY